jgi:hypothetical protein
MTRVLTRVQILPSRMILANASVLIVTPEDGGVVNVTASVANDPEAVSYKGLDALFAGTYDAKARSNSRNHKLNHNNSSNIELVADVQTSRQVGGAVALTNVSPPMIFSNYREVVTPEEAERYWRVFPGTPAENVVPRPQRLHQVGELRLCPLALV